MSIFKAISTSIYIFSVQNLTKQIAKLFEQQINYIQGLKSTFTSRWSYVKRVDGKKKEAVPARGLHARRSY